MWRRRSFAIRPHSQQLAGAWPSTYALRMNEDSPDTVLDDDALNALLERPFTELSVDELMAMKAAYAARGIRIDNSASIEQLVLAFLAGNVGVPCALCCPG